LLEQSPDEVEAWFGEAAYVLRAKAGEAETPNTPTFNQTEADRIARELGFG